MDGLVLPCQSMIVRGVDCIVLFLMLGLIPVNDMVVSLLFLEEES